MNTIIGQDINIAKECLLQGMLVAIPTETVYGLAGNALDVATVTKIFETKNRPVFDPLIVHTHSLDTLFSLATYVPKKAQILIEKLSPGPITFLLPKSLLIPDLVTSASPLVALRIPSHPLTLNLLKTLPFPLAAPSANPFGYISPTCAAHVYDQLHNLIPYILDGGNSHIGIESTIIGFENEELPTIYRLGGIPMDAITSLIGPVHVLSCSSSNPKAPGQLKSHYAPKKPFLVGSIPNLLEEYKHKKIAILSFQHCYDKNSCYIQLAPDGKLSTAARNLFASMRTLDSAPVDLILAEFVPDVGLGRAINDRLARAAAKNYTQTT
ncbi:MAG: L-threonylcarbamoyladenylate synthase [Chlamydiales bacterium]|nr:L-threonylcarbamoyladenylate synthase [Chlamydiales bacterium]